MAIVTQLISSHAYCRAYQMKEIVKAFKGIVSRDLMRIKRPMVLLDR
jgi:hypothetical protein